MYYPTIWDWGFFLGTMGFFTFMMFLFIRFVPMINIFEMKDLLHKQKHEEGHGHDAAAHGHVDTAAPGCGPARLRRRMETTSTQSPLYGLVAEFSDADQIVAAAEKARAAGYRRMDAYTPFPVHGLDEALDFHDCEAALDDLSSRAVMGTCAGYCSAAFHSPRRLLEPILKQPFITDVVHAQYPLSDEYRRTALP